MNPARLDASLSKRFTTGRQPVVIKKRKTGLPVQNRLGIEERNTGIVEMCCQKTHFCTRLSISPSSCAESACRSCNFRYRTQVALATAAIGAQET